jgi:hypothetical protein
MSWSGADACTNEGSEMRTTALDHLLGGRAAARRRRQEAARIRRENNLCLHGDDVRTYETVEARSADEGSEAVRCEICGKEKLVIGILFSENHTVELQKMLLEYGGLDSRSLYFGK